MLRVNSAMQVESPVVAAVRGAESHIAPYLSALDGLRFFAALFVLVAHVSLAVFKTNPMLPAVEVISTLSAMGMTLFFVLSGFVIHYNYHSLGGSGRTLQGLRFFVVARFSRLYPLFFALVAYDVYCAWCEANKYPINWEYTPYALPAYLTMTQSWYYLVLGDHSLIYQFAYYSSVSWSISTECFFYLAYLFFVPWLVRLRNGLTHILIGMAVYAIALYAFYMAERNFPAIDGWATSWFGPVASINNGYQDCFMRWLVYFSPYARIVEFIVGCLAANMLIRAQSYQPPPMHRWGATIGMGVLIVVIMTSNAAIYLIPNKTLRAGSLMLAPLVALLLYCCARFQSPISNALSSRWLCEAGEASYSIYLLHFVVIMYYDQPAIPSFLAVAGPLLLKAALTIVIVLLLARLVYVSFEKPTKDVVRRRLSLIRLPREVVWQIVSRPVMLGCLVACHLALLCTDKILMAHINALSVQ